MRFDANKLLAMLGVLGEDGVCPGCGKVHKEETLDEFLTNLRADMNRRIETSTAVLDIIENKAVNSQGLMLAGISVGDTEDRDEILMSLTYTNEAKTAFQVVGLNYRTKEIIEFEAPDAKTADAFNEYVQMRLVEAVIEKAQQPAE